MKREEFNRLARAGYNRIPLVREVLADLDTPLSVYLKLAAAPHSYLLESVHGGEKWGRYSIIGLPARTVLSVRGCAVCVRENGHVLEQTECDDPLAFIAAFQTRYRAAPGPAALRFTGGLAGYFGYHAVRYIEPQVGGGPHLDPLDLPDIVLLVCEELVVFDNLRDRLYVIVHVDPAMPEAYASGQARLAELVACLHRGTPHSEVRTSRPAAGNSDPATSLSQADFEAAVRRIKAYILAGDVMQVVLSQRLSRPFHATPLDLYRALRGLNPSPYMFYFDLDDHHVVGSSPEILVRLEDGDVTVRPIAGTRPRGHDAAADKALEAELLADPKERAEHLMLIDLGRNDVGRVAAVGTVTVTERMAIERYSHVMHIVSQVTGRAQAGATAMDVLRATFPAGTVSGAPKVRAIEIIDELEPVKRGLYAGAVGYLGFSGNMDTAIAIRTAIVKNGILHVQAGAGVVADSDPTREWEETLNKGRALFHAADLAEAGLDAEGDAP